jgi:hypothetical protein
MDDFNDLPDLTSSYQSEDQLIVALDFGTTFSGIAYALTNGNKPEVVSIMDWPGITHTTFAAAFTDKLRRFGGVPTAQGPNSYLLR